MIRHPLRQKPYHRTHSSEISWPIPMATCPTADRREGLFALYAFNHEVAKTREVVSEPILGQIRLQWWRDGIAAAYEGSPPRHAVLDPLAEAGARHALSRDRFDTLIEARETDLTGEPPADRAALLAYA